MQIEHFLNKPLPNGKTPNLVPPRPARGHRGHHHKAETTPEPTSTGTTDPAASPATAPPSAPVLTQAGGPTTGGDASPAAQPPRLMGDMNGDGKVDSADIDAFVLAISDREAYTKKYGAENYANGDFTGGGTVNLDDINAFRDALAKGQIKA